ncbi:efflux RND transporter permease subunit [Bosea sp. 685]|uniref:efflux RND transporter permease subunit n=1 Tax=Bosea sp. 685 TaxID=3080057 RepID=UPI0028937545|nr:efflux RND transporter permease subunit [Bosea sp. 685]WNJ93619.1 efflux RND transporter permease subunit [Bosea sp. 685]
MSVSAPFISRPIATSLLGVAVLLCGILGYLRLPVSALPQVDFPTIQITTQLPGANPETIASIVTAPLERQFGQIPSLSSMSSQSSFGLSQITLQFELDRDIDSAAQDVQSAINAAGSTLPRTLPYPPTYSKINPADAPILVLALTSDTVTLRQLSDLADTLLSPRLSEVAGVGHVSIEGGVRPAIRIQADLARLAAYSLGMEDLRTAIVSANVAGAKGALDGNHQAYTISANDQIGSASAYRDIVIAYRGSAPVFLRDVATVLEDLENTRVGGWFRGKTAVVLDVMRQPGANIVTTVDRVKQEIPRLKSSMPAGVDLQVVNDRTETIRASIADVQFTLALATALVVLVVLLFLRTVRATIIAGVALPLSLIATFAVMWLCGFSLDNLSLMALTIGTGFVVDDAIVMIENIVRNMEQGKKPLQAAYDGAREIGFTVISLTVSLVAVFIPLLFMTGLVGRMFREFALTLTIAVVVSAVISLTLTPMMCAKLLRHTSHDRENWLMRMAEWPVSAMARAYQVTLGWALKVQGLVLLITFSTFLLTIWMYVEIPKGFLPSQDTGLLNVVLEASPDVSFAEMKRLQEKTTKAFEQDSDVTGVVSVLGIGQANATANTARLTVTLRPKDDRRDDAKVIAERLRALAAAIPGVTAYVQPVQDIQITTRPSRSQYQYTLTGADQDEVALWARKLADGLRTVGVMRNVANETQDGGLRAHVEIDRAKAGRLGISIQTVDDTLNDAFGQRQIATLYEQSNQYRIILEAAPQYLRDPSSLSKLYVTGNTNTTGQTNAAGNSTTTNNSVQVPLSAFTRLIRETAPLSIAHQEQFPAATISFDLAPYAALGDAVATIAEVEKTIGMPSSVSGNFSADAAEFNKSLASQPWLILAAIVVIYLVLGVLYESYVHPFTILTTLPSAGVGALLALIMTRQELSIVALIGIVLLMGIVKKNAIMMIDFALDAERNEGLSPEESIVKACHLRFRPIMMTTLAALLGALPLALATGAGSELRQPLGITIIGGLILSQLLTLYTTPVIYLTLERLRRRLGGGRDGVVPYPKPGAAE